MKYFFLVFALLLLSCRKGKELPPFPKEQAEKVLVKRATITPKLDGIPNDPIWQKTEWIALDNLWQGDKTDLKIQYKLSWTPDALYVLLQFENYNQTTTSGNPLVEYNNQEHLIIYVDENNNGGLYENGFEVFKYHVLANNYVVGYDVLKILKTYRGHVAQQTTSRKSTTYKELRISLFKDTYTVNSPNQAVPLEPGKEVGFAMAYFIPDEEESILIGSIQIPEDYKNRIDSDSGLFATLQLTE